MVYDIDKKKEMVRYKEDLIMKGGGPDGFRNFTSVWMRECPRRHSILIPVQRDDIVPGSA